MRIHVKPAAGPPAPRPRPVRAPHGLSPDEPDEPGPSRSPRGRGADRDGAQASSTAMRRSSISSR
ncbi:hypothetical protein ACWEGV_38890, partial [Streptomyces sp. NPDC004976]